MIAYTVGGAIGILLLLLVLLLLMILTCVIKRNSATHEPEVDNIFTMQRNLVYWESRNLDMMQPILTLNLPPSATSKTTFHASEDNNYTYESIQ